MLNVFLGMGDIVTLVEKAAENIDQDEMELLAKKMAKGKFDLEDFSKQLKQMDKMVGYQEFYQCFQVCLKHKN